MSGESVIVITLCIIGAFVLGATAGEFASTNRWKVAVVEHGYGMHCPNDGRFVFLNDGCENDPAS